MPNPCPKIHLYRNPRLLALAKEAPYCMACGADNHDQIVAAHRNSQQWGKGMGIKAHDIPAYVCDRCHDLIDGRGIYLSSKDSDVYWKNAAIETWLWLMQSGNLKVKK